MKIIILWLAIVSCWLGPASEARILHIQHDAAMNAYFLPGAGPSTIATSTDAYRQSLPSGSGSGHVPGGYYGWGWGSGPNGGWGYGSGSAESPSGSGLGFGFGFGSIGGRGGGSAGSTGGDGGGSAPSPGGSNVP